MMNFTKFDLTGKTAIVTGGGRGIGKGICLSLAQAGANVVVANRNANTAEATAREVQAIGRSSLAIPTDVCIPGQIEQMVRKTVETFGTIDILVNNAGGTTREMDVPLLEMSENNWDSAVDLNLKSVFLCSQMIARVMVPKKQGIIVNISSWLAFAPSLGCIPYGSAKAGVNNLTQTMANILAPHNIRVNAIAPGIILTDRLGVGRVALSEVLELKRKTVPLGRLGTPEDIGWVVVFLASDAAAYITGQVLSVDGGSRLLP
jgi:NAD(P)-dependent dehydrogenase (short-subunit alcohol dehydrogenase family)